MDYIYATSSYKTEGLIEIEILSEDEVFDRLYSILGLTNQFDDVDELIKFIREWGVYDFHNYRNSGAITVATLDGDVLLQLG